MTKKQIHLSISPLRYCLYRRVSSDVQVERDLSLPEQDAQQRAHVARAGGVVVLDLQDEGLSAWGDKGDKRPEFQRMISAAKAGEFDVLLIHKSDRVFRNRTHAVTYKSLLRKHGVRVESVTEPWVGGEDPSEKLIEGVMECVSEFHNDNLAVEFAKGIRSAAAHKGRQHGPPIYGYKWAQPGVRGAGWALDEEAAQWIVWIFEHYVHDKMMLADLARRLNEMNVRPPKTNGFRGNVYMVGWQAQTISRMIRNIVYTGVCKLNDEIFPNAQHPAIISPQLFEAAQAAMDLRRPGKPVKSNALFAGGLLACPHCYAAGRKNSMHTHTWREKKGAPGYPMYVCGVRMDMYRAKSSGAQLSTTCEGFSIMDAKLLRIFLEAMEQLRMEADIDRVLAENPELKDRLFDLPELPVSAAKPDVDHLRREIDLIPKRVLALSEQNQRGYITLDQMGQALADLGRTEDILQEQLTAALAAHPPKTLTPFEAHKIITMMTSDLFDTDQKRDFLHTWFERIIPLADKSGIELVVR